MSCRIIKSALTFDYYNMEAKKDETEEFKCPTKRKPEQSKDEEFKEPPKKVKAVEQEEEEKEEESDNSFEVPEEEENSSGGSLEPEDGNEGNRINKATR